MNNQFIQFWILMSTYISFYVHFTALIEIMRCYAMLTHYSSSDAIIINCQFMMTIVTTSNNVLWNTTMYHFQCMILDTNLMIHSSSRNIRLLCKGYSEPISHFGSCEAWDPRIINKKTYNEQQIYLDDHHISHTQGWFISRLLHGGNLDCWLQ